MLKNDIAAAIDAQYKEQPDDLGLLRHALPNLPLEAGFATIVTGVSVFRNGIWEKSERILDEGRKKQEIM